MCLLIETRCIIKAMHSIYIRIRIPGSGVVHAKKLLVSIIQKKKLLVSIIQKKKLLESSIQRKNKLLESSIEKIRTLKYVNGQPGNRIYYVWTLLKPLKKAYKYSGIVNPQTIISQHTKCAIKT